MVVIRDEDCVGLCADVPFCVVNAETLPPMVLTVVIGDNRVDIFAVALSSSVYEG